MSEKEFWETEAMIEIEKELSTQYLDYKELSEIWCRAENEEDLRYELEGHFENAFEEMKQITQQYSKLFGKRLKMPMEETIVSMMRYFGAQVKKDRGLVEKWGDSVYLKAVAENYVRTSRARLSAYGLALKLLVK